MAKLRMNCAIALGLLVVGIVLLCLYTYSVEGFIQSPTFNSKKVTLAAGNHVSIYLFQDSKGMLTFKSASDPAFNKKVTCSQNKCTVATTGTLNDYAIYGYQDSCKKCIIEPVCPEHKKCPPDQKICPDNKQLTYTPDTTQKCYNLVYEGVTVSSGGKNFPSVLSSGILPMASLYKLPQKVTTLSIEGLSILNLGTKPTILDSNGANVCIELSLV
jgi:hypothetical protein